MAKRSALVFDQDRLTEDLRASAGRGMSALFPSPTTAAPSQLAVPASPPTTAVPPPPADVTAQRNVTRAAPGSEPDREGSSPVPGAPATSGGTGAATTPRRHDTRPSRPRVAVDRTTIRGVRKAVLQVGKEAATHRFTVEEKTGLMDIVYTYARRGYRTSENELVRIGANWLLDDYEEKGERSVLHRVLRALKE